MPTTLDASAPSALIAVIQALSFSRELGQVTAIVREAARRLTRADGVTFVLREGDLCYYADEDAIAPLWKGRRFPLASCISGWVMLNRQPAVVPDVYVDPRIPVDAYRPTFVQSLAMVPVRPEAPIGAIGAYWARRHTASDDELGILQTLADAAALALENVTIYGDLERALQREREARSAAENVSRLKDQFLSTLSHELRTPLNSIIGWLRMLEMGVLDQTQAERAMASVRRNASTLHRRVEDLLAASRIIVGKLALDRTSCDVGALIEETVEASRGDTERAHLRIKTDLERGVTVHGDADRLRQVFANVIGNAVKFTPADGDIVVKLRAVDRRAVVTVADSGPGIPSEVLPHIFERFRQADGSSTRHHGGLGLGLSVVGDLVRLHGGTVRAENAVSGTGAIVTVQLPLAD